MVKTLKIKLSRLEFFPKQLLYISLVAIYVLIFFMAFKPFHLKNHDTSMQWYLSFLYASATFLPSFIFICSRKFLTISFFDKNNWTIGKQILVAALILLPIAFLYLLIDYQYNDAILEFSYYFATLLKVCLLSIFPISLITIMQVNTFLKNKVIAQNVVAPVVAKKLEQEVKIESPIGKINDNLSEQLTKPVKELPTKVVIYSENITDSFELEIADFDYAISDANYVDVFYTNVGVQKKQTIRGSLKGLINNFENHPAIIQCHRSYLINIGKVKSFSGNSRGYKIRISDNDPIIPVSRNFIETVKKVLKKPD